VHVTHIHAYLHNAHSSREKGLNLRRDLQMGSRTLCGPVLLLGFPGPASLIATTRNSNSLPSTRFGTVNVVPDIGLALTGVQSPCPRTGNF